MCSRYEAPTSDQLSKAFGVSFEGDAQTELWPTYVGPFIRATDDDGGEDDAPGIEALTGVFGLLPQWTKDAKLARRTYNARSETAAVKPSFRTAWKNAQHCIIPATAIFEPDWRSGKAVPTRITRTDGAMLGIAGLWERWESPAGIVHSYSMLTVNADNHGLMKHYHGPDKEKRMVVVLPQGAYNDWLSCPAHESMDFMRQYPAERLKVQAS